MIAQLKLYVLGFLALLVGILSFLLQNARLKAKTKELRVLKKTAQIKKDVEKILRNRNVKEVLENVEKQIKNGDVSSLDN